MRSSPSIAPGLEAIKWAMTALWRSSSSTPSKNHARQLRGILCTHTFWQWPSTQISRWSTSRTTAYSPRPWMPTQAWSPAWSTTPTGPARSAQEERTVSWPSGTCRIMAWLLRSPSKRIRIGRRVRDRVRVRVTSIHFNPLHDQLVLSSSTDSSISVWRLFSVSSARLRER